MAAPAYAFTIARAAQILHEDEQLLQDLALDMEPEDGCLWIYEADEQEMLAFTDRGLEYLRELIADLMAPLFTEMKSVLSCIDQQEMVPS
jgi:hypothetical protein